MEENQSDAVTMYERVKKENKLYEAQVKNF